MSSTRPWPCLCEPVRANARTSRVWPDVVTPSDGVGLGLQQHGGCTAQQDAARKDALKPRLGSRDAVRASQTWRCSQSFIRVQCSMGHAGHCSGDRGPTGGTQQRLRRAAIAQPEVNQQAAWLTFGLPTCALQRLWLQAGGLQALHCTATCNTSK